MCRPHERTAHVARAICQEKSDEPGRRPGHAASEQCSALQQTAHRPGASEGPNARLDASVIRHAVPWRAVGGRARGTGSVSVRARGAARPARTAATFFPGSGAGSALRGRSVTISCERCAVRGAPRAPCAALARAHARAASAARERGRPAARTELSVTSHHATWPRRAARGAAGQRRAPVRLCALRLEAVSRLCTRFYFSFAYLRT
jgi:hypothetical protein